MIRVQYKDGKYAVVLICDTCEQRITNACQANAIHHRGKADENGLLEVFHVHKGYCDLKLENKIKGNELFVSSEELTTHLVRLIHNCGFPVDKLIEQNQLLKEMGSL